MSGLERLLIGRTLDGRYAIEELVGQGRGGSVYRARHTRLGSLLAVKVLASPRNPEARERFRRLFRHEAALAAGVRHQGLPLVIGSGTDAELDVDFFVTELLEGEKLSCVLAQRGKPPVALALRLLSEAAAGAGAAHRAGLVHRDLRPANLYLVRSPAERHVRARVVGFGVPQLASRATLASADAALVGYAPPELFAGGRLTPASDVFSLGAIGYELLAGRVPFDEAGRRALAEGRPVPLAPPAEPSAAVPAHVIEAILCALRPNPDERFADAAAFEIALDTAPAAGSPSVPAAAPAPRAAAAGAAPAAPDPEGAREEAAPAEVKELLARIDSEVVTAEAAAALEPPVAEDVTPPVEAEEAPAEVPGEPGLVAEAGPTAVAEVEPSAAEAAADLVAGADSASAEAESSAVAEAERAAIAVTVTVTEAEPAIVAVEPASVSAAGTALIEAESTVVEPAAKPFAPPPPPADLLRAASLAPPRRGGQRDGGPSHPPTTKPKAAGGRAERAAAAPVEPVGALFVEREIVPPAALEPQPPIEALAQVTPGAGDAHPEPETPAAPAAALPSPARRRRVLVAPSERPGMRPPVLVGLVVAVLLVVAVAGLAMFRRGAADSRAPSTGAANRLAAGTALAPATGQPADSQPAGEVQAPVQTPAEQPEEPGEEAAQRKTPEELAAETRRAQQDAALQQQAQQAAAAAQMPTAQQPPAPQPAPAAPAPAPPQPQLAAAPPPPAPEPTIAPSESRRTAPAIYDADAVEQQPALVNGPEVGRLLRERYPMQLLRSRIEGRVTATFVVREDGSVDPSSLRVVNSSNAAFNNATAGVLRRARFSPARVNGQPVKSQVTMPVVWAIDR